MRILITNIHLREAHGSEIFTAVIARELLRRGHEVYLWSPKIGQFHERCLSDVQTISGPGDWRDDGKFDIAIIQHLNSIRDYYQSASLLSPEWSWDTCFVDMLPPSEKIIVMCHGLAPEPEIPVKMYYLENARYTCISREIANHYPDFDWNIIHQPVDPSWFQMQIRRTVFVPERLVWASHRHILPDSLANLCSVQRRIGVHAAGNRPQYPGEIQDTYGQVDLVIGTGRWIYEGLAAGIPCIVADHGKTLGYVTPENIESFEEFNMTTRHPSATMSDWGALIDNYEPGITVPLRTYALNNYHVINVVDRMLESIGIDSFPTVMNKVNS